MMLRKNITIPEILWEKIKARADSLGISVSEILRRGAEDYLEKKDAEKNRLEQSSR